MTDHRQLKRPRYMSHWERTLYGTNSRHEHQRLGLRELFDAHQWLASRTTGSSTCSSRKGARPCCSKASSSSSKASTSDTPPLTFRLEHRQGGALATHSNEERILLFRSDRKGAIGKIIFSTADDDNNKNQSKEAKIHVLDVKQEYRGLDLGGLLFSEAMLAIQRDSLSIRCLLDAEEDIRRHNKLVGFYEKLGCSIKPNVRPQFLNNNDGESYRKVPMQIDLKPRAKENGSLVNNTTSAGFLPVVLLGSHGKPGKLETDKDSTPRACWFMTDDNNGQGQVQFRTSKGRYLTVDSKGHCGQDDAGDMPPDDLSTFQLSLIAEEGGRTDKELWILRSLHGTFLQLDPVSKELQASETPAFWQANSQKTPILSLTCVWDTPTRRQHYRHTWTKQTVEHVRAMKKRYLPFDSAQLSLKEALQRIKAYPAFPFRLDAASRGISLRTLCFQTAEAARAAGHPDWIQFIALIHALGSVVNSINVKTAIESEDDYDWTIPTKSRVVGCASSVDSTFAEFAYLDPDQQDERYNGAVGMYTPQCGLANVLLIWSGTEYLYHCLKHNDVDLPEEGLAVLRLFPLFDWHSKKLYENLMDEDDREIMPFVRDFDQLRRQAISSLKVELTDAECDRLWYSHYERLAAKFGAEGILEW